MTKFIGIVRDELEALDDLLTKKFDTYKEAHDAAESLCKRTWGDRGTIDVMEVWKVEREFSVEKCLFDDIFDDVMTELAERAKAGVIPDWDSYDTSKIENVYPVKDYHINLLANNYTTSEVVASVYVHTIAGNDKAEVTVTW